jgi:hypothetical protein
MQCTLPPASAPEPFGRSVLACPNIRHELIQGHASPPPLALSLSKGASTKVIPKGFDRLSPNG